MLQLKKDYLHDRESRKAPPGRKRPLPPAAEDVAGLDGAVAASQQHGAALPVNGGPAAAGGSEGAHEPFGARSTTREELRGGSCDESEPSISLLRADGAAHGGHG